MSVEENDENKTALVLGGGGFIGGHLTKSLKEQGFWVRSADLKYNEFSDSPADDFVICDLRDQTDVKYIIDRQFDEIYQLAADMGGAGYIFTGDNDADIMHNSATINLNVLETAKIGAATRFSIHLPLACILHIIRKTQTTRTVVKIAPTLPTQTVSMDGRNSFQSVSTLPITRITA